MENNDIRKTFAELEFVNCSNTEITTLSAQEVKQIFPVVDKDGNLSLMVDYFDDEFCITSTFVCDKIKIKNIEL